MHCNNKTRAKGQQHPKILCVKIDGRVCVCARWCACVCVSDEPAGSALAAVSMCGLLFGNMFSSFVFSSTNWCAAAMTNRIAHCCVPFNVERNARKAFDRIECVHSPTASVYYVL